MTTPTARGFLSINKIKNKLVIFLIYLIYREFGFTPKEFSQCLASTQNKIVKNSDFDKIELDKVLGVPFYEITNENFKELNSAKLIHSCVEYNESTNKYRFNVKITQILHDKWLLSQDKKHRDIRDFVKHEILTKNSFYKFDYVDKLYLTNGKKKHELLGVILISTS